MYRTATLSRIVTVTWETRRAELSCDVAVTYNYNGAGTPEILEAEITEPGEPYGISEAAFDGLVDDEIASWADEDYADWLSGQDA
jgi:hypothetical protein